MCVCVSVILVKLGLHVVLLCIRLIKHWDPALWMDVPVDGWAGRQPPPPVAAGGAGCAACVDGSNERGRPKFGGLLRLSHSHCGHGCLSLGARYQRAFWEFMPQGPPWSVLCLFPSRHILAFLFIYFFFLASSFLFPPHLFHSRTWSVFSPPSPSHVCAAEGSSPDPTAMSSLPELHWSGESIHNGSFFLFFIGSHL